MGDLLAVHDAMTVTNSLNKLFGPDLDDTYEKVQKIRKIHSNFLNPSAGNAHHKRRQTLRFAGFLLTDEVEFDGQYPARKFKQWMKWLTWIQEKGNTGTVTFNGAPSTEKPSKLILDALVYALPPQTGGMAKQVVFKWDEDSTTEGTAFTLEIVTGNPTKITMRSVKHNHKTIADGSDDEDENI